MPPTLYIYAEDRAKVAAFASFSHYLQDLIRKDKMSVEATTSMHPELQKAA